MVFLARKIAAQKWLNSNKTEVDEDEIPADAVTVDLRTVDATLSFWACEAIDMLEQVATAIASTFDHLQRLDVVWINHGDVVAAGIEIRLVPGETPYATFAEAHRDVARLDLCRLASIAIMIDGSVQSKRVKRFTEKEVAGLLNKAIDAKEIDLSQLKDSLAKKLGRA